MTNIKEIKDMGGNVVYPIAAADGTYMPDGTSVANALGGKVATSDIFRGTQAEYDALTTEEKEGYILALIIE